MNALTFGGTKRPARCSRYKFDRGGIVSRPAEFARCPRWPNILAYRNASGRGPRTAARCRPDPVLGAAPGDGDGDGDGEV